MGGGGRGKSPVVGSSLQHQSSSSQMQTSSSQLHSAQSESLRVKRPYVRKALSGVAKAFSILQQSRKRSKQATLSPWLSLGGGGGAGSLADGQLDDSFTHDVEEAEDEQTLNSITAADEYRNFASELPIDFTPISGIFLFSFWLWT